LEGGIMVTEEHPGGIPRRILREFEWLDLGEVHFSQVSTIQIHVENCVDWTILRVTDWKL
jgi:hypothetical protein